MSKALRFLAALLLLPLLTGCVRLGISENIPLGERSFAIVIALDAVDDGKLRMAVQIPSGASNLNESSAATKPGGDAAEDNAMNAALTQQGDYYMTSVVAEDYNQALALLYSALPRRLDFSHLRQIVVSEKLARSDALIDLMRALLATRTLRTAAFLVVARNDAREFVSQQQPFLGSRLSEYIDLRMKSAAHYSFIAQASLAEVWESMSSQRVDSAITYVAVNDFSNPQPLTAGRILDDLPGHLPRLAVNQTEYLGAAVFNNQKMTGAVTGLGMELTHMLRGDAREVFYTAEGVYFTLSQRRAAKHRVTEKDGRFTLHAEVWLSAIPAGFESSLSMAALRTHLENDFKRQLLFYQALATDPIGFGYQAARRFATIDQWEAFDWRSAFQAADIDVVVHVEESNAI